jgi:hypothetical protein
MKRFPPFLGVGAARDHIRNGYYMAYASTGVGSGRGDAGTIHIIWSKTLVPKSPVYETNPMRPQLTC